MSQIDLIIFDCDGVLIDSELISSQCAASELQALGMSITAEEVLRRFLGHSRAEIAAAAAREGYPVPADFVSRLVARIENAFETQLVAVPGVAEVLSCLPQKVCVASGSPLPYIRRSLEITGLIYPFGNNLFSSGMVSRPKPAPDVFLFAAKQMNVPPSHCLVIEDSLAGVLAARRAGMRVVAFLGGSHLNAEASVETYKEAACTETLLRMEYLPSVIERLEKRDGL